MQRFSSGGVAYLRKLLYIAIKELAKNQSVPAILTSNTVVYSKERRARKAGNAEVGDGSIKLRPHRWEPQTGRGWKVVLEKNCEQTFKCAV